MEFRLLGPLEVLEEGRSVPLPAGKQRALLALLLLNAGRVVSVERLVAGLWGERPPPTAVSTLYAYVSRLRTRLPRGILETRPPGYLLHVGADDVDLARFEGLRLDARRMAAEGRHHECGVLAGEALALWRGAPLADVADDLEVRAELARLDELRLTVVEERIDAELALGRHADVVSELDALCATHPLRERLRAQLMLALYGDGRQADALAVYRDTRSLLVDQLGIEPSLELQQLERRILAHDPTLSPGAAERDGPPRPNAFSTPPRLPIQHTRFVGRSRELDEIAALLGREDVRLLTLVGAGGIGKTRLALQAGEECSQSYRHGVGFVNLAPVADPGAMGSTIGRALGLGDERGLSALALLRSHLAERELLLILDNLEHLLPGAPMLAGLLAACPRLNVLATSREPLHLGGEREYVVQPLANVEAVRLFNERARTVQPDWRESEEVADICRRIDALPLAVELAAARAKVLTPPQILERLERRLPLLTNGPRDAPERQRTLRATIDWSHALLDAAERDLFARVGVFSGGFTLDSAEAVCEADVDTLQSLVDKSLVRHQTGRFTMLETVREYALEQLASLPVFVSTQKLHGDHFLSLAEQAAEAIPRGRDDAHWLGLLESERDNLRATFDRFVAAGDGDSAQRLVCALFHLWHDRGPAREGAEWTAQALALPSHPRLRAATLCHGSHFDVGRGWAQEGLQPAETFGDHASVMMALSSMGVAAYVEHQPRRAADCFERALRAARATGDQAAIGKAIVSLLSHNAVDDPKRAAALAEEAAGLRNVNTSMKAMIGMCRGVVAEQAGAEEVAMSLYRDSLARAQEIDFDRTPAILMNLGWLALRQRDLAEARARLTDGVVQADARGLRAYAAGGLAYLAVLAAAEGDPLLAATLRGAVETYRETVGEPGVTEFGDGTIDRSLAAAKASVGRDEWRMASAAGRRMSLGDAIERSLERRLGHRARVTGT